MAWDEWEQLKSEAAERQSTRMRLNQVEPGAGGASPARPGEWGDLKVSQSHLACIGSNAFGLYNQLWDRGRSAMSGSDSAAGSLSRQGFALGGGLRHVAKRWDEQLSSLRDACAHISRHMRVTDTLHSEDEGYVRRRMSSIDVLNAGFDDRVGAPGKRNPVYGPPGAAKDA